MIPKTLMLVPTINNTALKIVPSSLIIHPVPLDTMIHHRPPQYYHHHHPSMMS